MPKLTKTAIDRITWRGRDEIVWDTDIAGFGVRVAKNNKKTFVVQYRAGSGRGAPTRRMTIGPFGSPWTVDSARRRARELLSKAALGSDPAQEKQAHKSIPTISVLCDHYLKYGVAHKKPSTLATDKGRIVQHIKPLLGHIRVDHLTVAHAKKFYEDLAAGRTAKRVKTKKFGLARVTGGEGTARRTVGLLGGILAYAKERGWIDTNVAHRVKRRPDRKVERFLNEAEVARLSQAIDDAEAAGANYKSIAIIRLLLLTGARKAEIEKLRWSEVDFDNGLLRLGDTKSGASTRPLAQESIDILRSLPRHVTSKFCFPAERSEGHFVGAPRVWRAIRAAAGLDDVRLHDLRHSVASFAISSGASLAMVAKLLGHKDLQSAQRYAHLHDGPMKALATAVSAKVKGSIGRKED